MPKRIQRKRTKGWKMPEGAVYVGRPTKWGNPCIIKRLGRQWLVINPIDEEEIECNSRQYARKEAARMYGWIIGPEVERNPELRKLMDIELRSKDLACWCPLDQPCHADVLLEIANS